MGGLGIQDPSAVLVLYMIGFLKLHHILDMCAAPGSKSFLLSNLFPHAEIIASDHKVKKIARLKANISRLGFNHIRVIQSDGLSLPVRKIFDLILVDAPCSGLGVIQRKGDIRWSKSESVIVELAGLQSRLLDEAANRVKSGGYLLYSTCTLEPEETDQQAADFLQRHPEFTASQPVTPIKTLENMIKGFYYYSLPHLHAQSGTFAALFQKT